MKYTFPEDKYGQSCVLVPIDTALVPLVAGALGKFLTKYVWETDSDYTQGYPAIAEVLANMRNNCLQQLVDREDRLYRLVDSIFNGTDYVVRLNPDGSESIDPAIPTVPPDDVDKPSALRAHVGRLMHLGENSVGGSTYAAGAGIEGAPALPDDKSVRATIRALQGIIKPGWFGIGGTNATLADVIGALKIGSDTDQGVVNDALQEILGTGSDANSIFNTFRGLFDTAVDTSLEGGQIALQLVAAMSNAALLAQVGKEIQLLNRFLSGTTAQIGAPALGDEGVLYGYPPGGGGDRIPIGELARQTTANTDLIRAMMGATNEPRQVIPLLAQILEAIGTGGGGGTGDAELLQEIIDKLEAIRTTVSPQGPTPQLNLYYLVQGLLDAARCICDAVGGENTPGGPLNPEPTYACESEVSTSWLRVAEWVPVPTAEGQDPEVEAYAARFVFPAGYGFVGEETVNGRPVYRMDESADELRWCEAADWTGADRPFYKVAPRGTAQFAADVPLTGGLSNIGNDTYGESQVWPTTVAQGGGAVRIGWVHYWEPGKVPSLNFWIKSKPFTVG